MRELDRQAKKRIQNALDVYDRYPGEQTMFGVFDEILFAYMFNVICFVPIELTPDCGKVLIKTMYVPEQLGHAYIMFTGMREAEDPTAYAAMSYRTVLKHAAAEEGIVGIRINPGDRRQNLFISKENIGIIIRNGEEEISGFLPEFREKLEKYQVVDVECGPGGRPLVDRKAENGDTAK